MISGTACAEPGSPKSTGRSGVLSRPNSACRTTPSSTSSSPVTTPADCRVVRPRTTSPAPFAPYHHSTRPRSAGTITAHWSARCANPSSTMAVSVAARSVAADSLRSASSRNAVSQVAGSSR